MGFGPNRLDRKWVLVLIGWVGFKVNGLGPNSLG